MIPRKDVLLTLDEVSYSLNRPTYHFLGVSGSSPCVPVTGEPTPSPLLSATVLKSRSGTPKDGCRRRDDLPPPTLQRTGRGGWGILVCHPRSRLRNEPGSGSTGPSVSAGTGTNKLEASRPPYRLPRTGRWTPSVGLPPGPTEGRRAVSTDPRRQTSRDPRPRTGDFTLVVPGESSTERRGVKTTGCSLRDKDSARFRHRRASNCSGTPCGSTTSSGRRSTRDPSAPTVPGVDPETRLLYRLREGHRSVARGSRSTPVTGRTDRTGVTETHGGGVRVRRCCL